MHSHDRTLLANLGFADPDRKDHRHDLACAYLARREVAEKIARESIPGFDGIAWDGSSPEYRLAKKVATLEYHVSKGEGQYSTTIGFIDVVINIEQFCHVRDERDLAYRKYVESYRDRIGIEVKISKIPIGDLLRQMKLYRSYCSIPLWVFVSDYSITNRERDSLRNECIRHFELGDGFETWLTDQDEQDDEPSQAITL